MNDNFFAIPVKLSPQQVTTIGETGPAGTDLYRHIGAVASHLLAELASGGVMIGQSDVQRIEAAMGSIGTPSDLVAYVEAAAGRSGNSIIVTWRIDETYVPALTEYAESRGVTLQQLVQDCMDWACDQGWFYKWENEPRRFRMDPDHWRQIAVLVGKPEDQLTGEDIFRLVTELATAPPAKQQLQIEERQLDAIPLLN